jgi:hypothetical protein
LFYADEKESTLPTFGWKRFHLLPSSV